MNKDELQLVDDLVKIGFPVIGTIAGAILGGVSTYIVTKLNHKSEFSKEIARRKYELILQTANDVAEFEHLIGTYASAVTNKVSGIAGGIDIDEARSAILNKNQPLRRARMTLKLLGLGAAGSSLEEYIEITREVVKKGTFLQTERAQELSAIIGRGPVKFYESLEKELNSK